MNTTTRVLLAAVLCTVAVACSKKVKEVPPPTTTGSTAGSATTMPGANTGPTTLGMYGPGDLDSDSCLRQRVVYFDYDSTAIRSEFQSQIACHAEYLRQFSDASVSLEGNSDERGSREYNLGLGERRGNAVQSALSAAGASSSQQNVVSYGEERPMDRGHSESAWGKNRRVEIVYSSR